MGFDVTVKRRDGLPLGSVADVEQTLASVFIGLVFRRSLSGPERLQNLVAENREIPEAIRAHLLESPPLYEGDYQGANFWVELHMSVSEPILQVNAVLRGTVGASEEMFALLDRRFGWITTHP
jgi:hypothetical protein